jgi:hypothetical protein
MQQNEFLAYHGLSGSYVPKQIGNDAVHLLGHESQKGAQK